MPPGCGREDEPGRLLHADERQPSEEGRFARDAAAGPPPSAHAEVFYGHRKAAPGHSPCARRALVRSSASAAAAASRSRHGRERQVTLDAKPVRIVSLSPTATEDLFAIGAGKQVVAVDDQSNYPASAPKTKLSGFTPNAEAIAAYKPDLVVVSDDANGLVAALGEARRSRCSLEPAATNLAGAYAQIRAARQGDRAPRRRGGGRRADEEGRSRRRSRLGAEGREQLSVYDELEPRLLLGDVEDVHRPGLHAARPAATSPTRPTRRGSGYPQLSAEYIVAASPDLIVLADTKCCGQTAAKVGKRGRAGARSRPSRTAAWSASATTSRRAGARGSSTSCSAVAAQVREPWPRK